jgi:serine/threonine-protein kinase RsbT
MDIDTETNASIVAEIDVADIRRRARLRAERLGFKSAGAYRFATAVSELANNLYFHTPAGGTIRIVSVKDADRVGVEVVAEDKGPGIADIGLAMQDGFSTNHGLGSGLPGVKRLMDEFSIESTIGVGTRIVARLWRS